MGIDPTNTRDVKGKWLNRVWHEVTIERWLEEGSGEAVFTYDDKDKY